MNEGSGTPPRGRNVSPPWLGDEGVRMIDQATHGRLPGWFAEITEAVKKSRTEFKNESKCDGFFGQELIHSRGSTRTTTTTDDCATSTLSSTPSSPSQRLEELWKGLDRFEKSHRGRLDSASIVASAQKSFDDVTRSKSEISTSTEKLNFFLDQSKSKSIDSFDRYRRWREEEDNLRKRIIDELLSNDFVIPILPQGKRLIIDILSTWGDRHYVGLNGIEMFAIDGLPIEIQSIRAVPSDINIRDDPRVVENLIDGVNRTRDDVHLWLAPFERGRENRIEIVFRKFTTIAMIRIWNYNKSRVHSQRGVRDIRIRLDSTDIFRGEIARACGEIVGGVDAFGDTILFTIDDIILEKIAKNDRAYPTLIDDESSLKRVNERTIADEDEP